MSVAGNNDYYTWRLVKETELGSVIVEDEEPLLFPRISHIIKEVVAVPPSAMAWWGFRIFRDGIVDAFGEDPMTAAEAVESAEALEALLKERGVNPNMSRDSAGSRGTAAHTVLELLAGGEPMMAEGEADIEAAEFGTEYGRAVIAFWQEKVQPFIEDGQILEVLSEKRVRSIRHWYQGTFDLGIKWAPSYIAEMPDEDLPGGWEILDLKTHKPADGFTLRGAGYDSDAFQIRAYRMAFEEMGLGKTIGQRTIVARGTGKRAAGTYLEDAREVSEQAVKNIIALYHAREAFKKGALE